MPVIILPDPAAVRRLAQRLAADASADDIVALDGPLGAGKTTLVRFLVEALGGDPDQVTSPTFTLLHSYQARVHVIHVDAYRLSGPADLAGLGFAELCEGGIGIVEWAVKVLDRPDPHHLWHIDLDHRLEGGRTATVTTPRRLEGKWLQEPAED